MKQQQKQTVSVGDPCFFFVGLVPADKTSKSYFLAHSLWAPRMWRGSFFFKAPIFSGGHGYGIYWGVIFFQTPILGGLFTEKWQTTVVELII